MNACVAAAGLDRDGTAATLARPARPAPPKVCPADLAAGMVMAGNVARIRNPGRPFRLMLRAVALLA